MEFDCLLFESFKITDMKGSKKVNHVYFSFACIYFLDEFVLPPLHNNVICLCIDKTKLTYVLNYELSIMTINTKNNKADK